MSQTGPVTDATPEHVQGDEALPQEITVAEAPPRGVETHSVEACARTLLVEYLAPHGDAERGRRQELTDDALAAVDASAETFLAAVRELDEN